MENVVWIGNRGDGALIMIALDNALNLTGANFTFADKSEGALPFEFQAHQSGLEDATYAPCEIIIFDSVA